MGRTQGAPRRYHEARIFATWTAAVGWPEFVRQPVTRSRNLRRVSQSMSWLCDDIRWDTWRILEVPIWFYLRGHVMMCFFLQPTCEGRIQCGHVDTISVLVSLPSHAIFGSQDSRCGLRSQHFTMASQVARNRANKTVRWCEMMWDEENWAHFSRKNGEDVAETWGPEFTSWWPTARNWCRLLACKGSPVFQVC